MLRFLRKHYLKLVQIVGFFLLWHLFVTVFGVKEYIVPSPLAVFAVLFQREAVLRYAWLKQIAATLSEIAGGFALSAVVGVVVALLVSWSKLLRGIFMPLLVFFNSIPKVAMAPLLVLWFGYGIMPNTLIAFLIAFFPVVINTAAGLNAVEEDLLDLVNYLHATTTQVFLKIRIPNALPYLFSGLKISTTLSVVGAMIGEFIASERGLGMVLMDAQAVIDTPPMFGSLVIISAVGLSLFGLVTFLERLVVPWQRAGGVA